ncbi:MAG: transglycosylase SLT domain-containing protein, partial [Nanoarchaeota archaeon]
KDAAGDYDGDGLSNLREYTLGTNPKDVKDPGDKPLGTEFTRSDCQATFNKDIEFIESGKVKPGAIPQYKFGDRIEVNPAGLITITRPNEGVQIKVEIFDENNNLEKVIRFIAHDIANGNPFPVWDIPEASVGVDVPSTGLYKFKFSIIKNAPLSDPVCLDKTGRTTNSIIEKKILIYNPELSGCVDSGGYDITRQQSCISGNNGIQAFVDECSDGKLIEYSCQQDQCISQIVGCPDGMACQSGECVLRKNLITPAPTLPPAAQAEPVTPVIASSIFEGFTRESSINLLEQIPGNQWDNIEQVESRAKQTFTNLQNLNTLDYINSKSKEAGIDPLLTLAVITVESNGIQTSSSSVGAIGLMQIYPSAHPEYNVDRLENDALYNIDAGIKILKGYYHTYAANDGEYIGDVGICENENEVGKRWDYTKWQRALRAYNGFGCIPPNADNFYVEKVMVSYYLWSELYPSLTA